MNHEDKYLRLNEIQFDVENKAETLEQLKDLANQLLQFLNNDSERDEIQGQMENLLSLTVMIFEALARNLEQVRIIIYIYAINA
jgi:hypothetical protein